MYLGRYMDKVQIMQKIEKKNDENWYWHFCDNAGENWSGPFIALYET